MRVILFPLIGGLLLMAAPAAVLAQTQPPVIPAPNSSTHAEQLPEPRRSREADNGTEVFTYVKQMPQFPGGQTALLQTLAQTLYYPTEALQERQQGRVFVSFVVGTTGIVQDAQVVKSLHPALDREAVKAVMGLPNFVPGNQNGKPKAVRLTVPTTFRLPDNVDELLAQRAAAP